MPIKDIVISILKEKQSLLMERYEILEGIQRERPELYSMCQHEMDRADSNCELLRREIWKLGGSDGS